MRRSRALRSPVWQYFTKVGPIQAECSICETIVSCKSGTTSAMFFHLQKRHPDLDISSPASKLHSSNPGMNFSLGDEEGTEWKVELPDYEEYSAKNSDWNSSQKVKVGARQTGVAFLLDFLSLQYDTGRSLEADVFIHCDDGQVPAHRIVLGAISPLLFSALTPYLEEGEDHVFIYGFKIDLVTEFLSWVYKGGTFPKDCVEIAQLLGIESARCPPLPKKIMYKEDIKEEVGEPKVKRYEVSDNETADNDEEDEKDPDYTQKPVSHEKAPRVAKLKEKDSDKLTKSLHTYFLDVQGDRTKLKCLLCDQVLDVDEESQSEAVFQHFQSHPEELLRIYAEKNNSVSAGNGEEDEWPPKIKKPRKMKNKRSKVWLYFSLISTGLSECKMCHARMNMETGTTSSMIYHLKSKHEDIFALHQFTRDPATHSPRHRLPGGADITDPATGMPIKIRLKRGPKRKKLKEMKTKRSKIWLFFTLKDDDQVAECNICGSRVLVEKGAVNKMINHLRSEHTEAHEEFEEQIAGSKELCELCSERVAPGRLLHHNYANHYEIWSEDAKAKLAMLSGQLESSAGGSLGRLFSHGQLDNSLTCTRCETVIQADAHHMELHARTEHPEVEVGPQLPLPAWLYYSWSDGEGSCQLCLLKNLREADVLDHMKDKHPIDFEDLQTWAEAFREPEDELSFKTALLLERYEKRGLTGGDILIGEEASKRRPTFGKTEDAAFRTCMQCRKVFSSSSAMRYHIRVVHSALKPFTCHLCEKSFGRKDTLESHILSHSNIKPFMCSICGKQFKSVSLRNLHERRERGEKRFSCSFCQKKFANGQQKRNHERTHTGEKPYDCEHCGRMFAQKHQLVTHLRTHTGERPYSCNGCSQRFKHLSTRRNHKCAGDRKPPGLPDSLPDRLEQRSEVYRAAGLFPS